MIQRYILQEAKFILGKNGEQFGIEVKASSRPGRNDMKGLLYWKKYQPQRNLILCYGGNKTDTTTDGISMLPWNEINKF
jgi:hypothetical protein